MDEKWVPEVKNIEEVETSLKGSSYYLGLNRTMCDALQDMRMSVKTLNFSPMRGLIEEVQCMANRMESALETNKDWNKVLRRAKKLNGAFKYRMREYESLVETIEAKKKELEELGGSSK